MLKQAPVPTHPVLIRAGKFALAFLAAVLVAVFCALIALRFWVWPSLPQQQASLAAALAPELQKHGLTLRMGTVTTDWPSWVTPRLKVDAIEIFKTSGERVLAVKELEATLGWKSLAMVWRWQPIFHEIRLLDPFVFVERESQGVLRVAGFEVRPTDVQDPAAINWLLRQGRLRADGGEMIWFDRVRAKSARLQSITLALNNLGFAHSWALKATPPPTLGDPFVVQGDFSHGFFKSPADFLSWGGEAFVQFDRVNFAELLGFIHLPRAVPLQMTSGSGAVRAWLKLNKSQLDDLTLDVNVSNVSLAWGRTKRPMSMQELSGRIQAQIGDARNKVALKNIKLKSTQLAETVEISDAQLVIQEPPGSDTLSGQISAASIDLNAGMWLMDHLPLAADLKKQITQLSPRGRLSSLNLSWREAAQELSALSLETSFSDLALAAGAKRPGFSGLSGKIKASESGGEIALDSKKTVLTFPGIFREPALSFDSLSAQASFSGKNLLVRLAGTGSANAQEISVQIKKLNIENPDLKADASGSYRWSGKGAGRAEFTSRIARVKPERIARYTPLEVDADTREWLRTALLPGKPYSGTVELAGDLNDFPFRTTGSGKFLVRAKAEDASLRPAPGWPVMSDIDAEVEFDRHQFRLVAKNAKLSGLAASEINASIEDMEAKTVILKVVGGLTGDLSRLIDAVNRSPLRQSMGGVTSSAVGRGNSNLELSMALDLTNTDRSKVNGTLSLSKASLRLMPAMPEALGINAEIGFDEDGIKAMKAQGQMAGGPVNATATRAARTTTINVDGQVSGSGLESWIDNALGYSARNSITGSSRYTAQIELSPGETRARIQSALTGISSDLPAPFRKSSSEDWGLRVEMIQSQGRQATARSAARSSTQRWVVSSNQQRFNARINVGSGKSRETIIDLDSPTVAGQLSWQPARPNIAVLRARLSKLHLEPSKSSESGQAPQPTDAAAQEWPTVDAVVEDFRVGERQWGRLEVQASPVAATRSWEILKFSVTNPDAVLTGQGQWAMMGAARGPKRSRTSLNIELQMKNGGALLARSGYPNLVRATPGKIEGALNWPGSPIQFSGAALSGNLSFNLDQGQFLKSEPGIARLVGVLNLQSLPRRIKLDFRDVFSEGFTYERIRGDLQFNNGEARTQNFRIIGIQASVILEGTADLKDERQDLRVLVLPEVNAGLASLGYAALVNPAVGLGAFIAQYILRNPVRELLSYEYKVTGSWTEPVVEQVKREVKTDSPEIKAPAK